MVETVRQRVAGAIEGLNTTPSNLDAQQKQAYIQTVKKNKALFQEFINSLKVELNSPTFFLDWGDPDKGGDINIWVGTILTHYTQAIQFAAEVNDDALLTELTESLTQIYTSLFGFLLDSINLDPVPDRFQILSGLLSQILRNSHKDTLLAQVDNLTPIITAIDKYTRKQLPLLLLDLTPNVSVGEDGQETTRPITAHITNSAVSIPSGMINILDSFQKNLGDAEDEKYLALYNLRAQFESHVHAVNPIIDAMVDHAAPATTNDTTHTLTPTLKAVNNIWCKPLTEKIKMLDSEIISLKDPINASIVISAGASNTFPKRAEEKRACLYKTLQDTTDTMVDATVNWGKEQNKTEQNCAQTQLTLVKDVKKIQQTTTDQFENNFGHDNKITSVLKMAGVALLGVAATIATVLTCYLAFNDSYCKTVSSTFSWLNHNIRGYTDTQSRIVTSQEKMAETESKIRQSITPA